MTGYEIEQMAAQADALRRWGLPGFAEELEALLSDELDIAYARHVQREAERQIAEHHRRMGTLREVE